MKKNYVSALVCAIAAAALLALPSNCPAQDSKDEQDSFWAEPEQGTRWGEPSDEMIDRVMNQLQETDPQKARKLKELRDQDPEKFKAELREVMREHFRARHREGMEPNDGPRFRSRSEGERAGKTGKGRRLPPRAAQERNREFLEWLKKYYPEQAQQVAKLQEADPDRYDRRLALSMKRYHRLFEAVRDNPQMADLLKKDFELKQERDQILTKLRRADDDAVRKDLTEQLQQVVNKRFDVIVQRKQKEYEQLLKKLETLKQQVKKSEAEVAKWKEPDFKNQSVKARVEELISPQKEFKWD